MCRSFDSVHGLYIPEAQEKFAKVYPRESQHSAGCIVDEDNDRFD